MSYHFLDSLEKVCLNSFKKNMLLNLLMLVIFLYKLKDVLHVHSQDFQINILHLPHITQFFYQFH